MQRKILAAAIAGALASSTVGNAQPAASKALEPLRDRQPKPEPVQRPKALIFNRGRDIRRFLPRRNG